jgi:hypothetical protein
MQRRLTITAIALAALAIPQAADAADRDHDRMRDSWEKHYKLNTKKNDARRDRDRDGLRNVDEYRSGTNPRKRDSDDDGVRDNREGAGTIKSFDAQTGVLVIDLFGSDQDLTGKVDATTEIECEDERPQSTATGDTRGDGTPEDDTRARHGDDDDDDRSGPSDNSGPGNAEDRDEGEHDDGEHGDRDDDEREFRCDASFLDAGRTVKEAELNEGDDGPADVFDEIELIVR